MAYPAGAEAYLNWSDAEEAAYEQARDACFEEVLDCIASRPQWFLDEYVNETEASSPTVSAAVAWVDARKHCPYAAMEAAGVRWHNLMEVAFQRLLEREINRYLED